MKQTYAVIGIVTVALIGAFVASYEQYIAKHDFVVVAHADCDPAVQSCFQNDCKSGVSDCDTKPYKKIEKNAKNLTPCGDGVACTPMDCAKGEEGCRVTLCTQSTIEDGERCANKLAVEPAPEVEAAATATITTASTTAVQ